MAARSCPSALLLAVPQLPLPVALVWSPTLQAWGGLEGRVPVLGAIPLPALGVSQLSSVPLSPEATRDTAGVHLLHLPGHESMSNLPPCHGRPPHVPIPGHEK